MGSTAAKIQAAEQALAKARQYNADRTEYEARTAHTIGLPSRPPATLDLRLDWHPEWNPLARWAVLSERRDEAWVVVGMWALEEFEIDDRRERGALWHEEIGRPVFSSTEPTRVDLRIEPDDDALLALCRERDLPVRTVAELPDLFLATEPVAGRLALALDAEMKRRDRLVAARTTGGLHLRKRWEICGLLEVRLFYPRGGARLELVAAEG